MSRITKHHHGTPNPTIKHEEELAISIVKRALANTVNPQTIGRNGELPILEFFNRYLPPTFKAVSGHFITPAGHLSPQIDIMIIDSRYPLLAQNLDGSVLVALHSLLFTIEIKTNLNTKDIKKSWADANYIFLLSEEIYGKDCLKDFRGLTSYILAYNTRLKLDSLEAAYTKFGKPNFAALDTYILRISETEQPTSEKIGAELHFEPDHDAKEDDRFIDFELTCRASYTPLSDLYYTIIQNGYYTLGAREYGFTEIGAHIMDYMSWSTCPWDKYYSMLSSSSQ